MPATATNPADPLDAAHLEHEAADVDVRRLTAKIKELKIEGAMADPILLARLEIEREAAFKLLRRADLEAAEEIAAASGPLPPKVLQKIRLRRRRVEDLHSAIKGRMGETQRLREHLGGVRHEIAELKDSWAFRGEQQEMRNAYLFPRKPDARDNPAPARGATKKTTKSMEHLARLERDLETTGAELKIAEAAQAEASERWESEKRGLDGWEAAVRRLGPAAAAALNAMVQPGWATMGRVTGQSDFRNGIPGHTTPLIS